nr:RNA-directed DNA polymerase, eukaryota, reverse transcriptase zinc-binding domain protein [Tanacetum cinerariifolium]
DSINLNVDESKIPSDLIVQSVDINTNSTSYVGAAGVSAKDQPNVNSNFRTLVANPVFDGVNVSIPRKVVKKTPLGHKAAMICRRDDIPEEDMPPRRRFTFIAPPTGCDVAESSAAARAPRSQYDFVDTVKAVKGLVCSPGHDTWTIARAADRAEDIVYGNPLMNVGEFPEMDPYEEVAQQGQVHSLSPAYVPDPIELDEHVPVHVPEPKHPKYHALSNEDV